MTPSAARGILESIFWKPEFRWLMREIWVLNPIQYISWRKNEITDRQSVSSVQKGKRYLIGEHRTQRHMLGLKDVAYVIRADIKLRPHATEPKKKYEEIFSRHVRKGQFYRHPYFGIREFSAFFEHPSGDEKPIDKTMNLGFILFDQHYEVVSKKGDLSFYTHDAQGRKMVQGKTNPVFFEGILDRGILRVPEDLHERVA